LDYVSRLRPPADKLAEPGWTNPDFPKFARQPVMAPYPWGPPPAAADLPAAAE
jgi:hypothetical protein